MLDFLKRKARQRRVSKRWFALVVLAQSITATCTGVVLGYLMMFVVVLVFAQASVVRKQQSDFDTRQSRTYGYRPSEPGRSESALDWNTFQIEHAQHEFLSAFDPRVPDDEKCVRPNVVFAWSALFCVIATWAGILIATHVERRRLAKDGGWALGMAVNGRHLKSPTHPAERRLVNVVEELAVAFSHRPPSILILDAEPGINVFAAGLTPDDSIICVTAGALDALHREELQAVIAHEYSHLVSGDTQFGTRLTAILYGLVGVRSIAHWAFITGRDLCESEEDGFFMGYFMILTGVMVYPFGLIGSWSAQLLALATNRSREKYADADAVEKTRNPLALASAMRRIEGSEYQGRVRHTQAAIIAPMLFVDGKGVRGMFSTHPPIPVRLRAIDPGGDHRPIHPETKGASLKHESPKTVETLDALFSRAMTGPNGDEAQTVAESAEEATARLTGGLAPFYETIEQPIVQFACLPASLPIAVPLLLGIESDSLPHLESREQLSEVFDRLEKPARYALLAAVIDHSHQATAQQSADSAAWLSHLESELGEFDWFRHGWMWLLNRKLNPGPVNDTDSSPSKEELALCTLVVLSTLSACDSEGAMTDYEFLRGWSHMGFETTERLPPDSLTWEMFEQSVETLSSAPPRFRTRLLVAIANTVAGDNVISPTEAVLVQVIRTTLGDGGEWVVPTWVVPTLDASKQPC